jgi:F-type H+-transporting ATPase subunit b
MHEFFESGMHWNLINFAIFVGVLFFFLKKPVKEFWASREGEIRFAIEEAERVSREAKNQYDDLKGVLARLDAETRALILSLEREGEMEKKQLTDDGLKRAERLKQDSRRIIEQEERKARETLKEQAASLALETAQKMIQENFQDQDQTRIADQYIAGLERQEGGRAV